MSYLEFEKDKLVNLQYSLSRELLRSNRAGSYSSTTIIGCNTRKYHGLLIMPQYQLDGGMHVLLSSLDETVIQQNAEFNLAIHRFKGGVYSPGGHKYITDFVSEPIPTLTYRVGGVVLTKEMLFVSNSDQVIIKYTLKEAHSPTRLRFRPFLAFRNIHTLTRANNDIDRRYDPVPNGIKVRMYEGYPYLYLQFSKDSEYIHVPDTYYNFTYTRERARGYDYVEDLYTPGYFEMPVSVGESIYFIAGVEDANPAQLGRMFSAEVKRRTPRNSFENCLENAAQQFIVTRGKHVEIIAGFPWFGRVARDAFIALPDLAMVKKDFKTVKAVIDTLISEMNGPLFPNYGMGNKVEYNAADASLWLFWTLQQYKLFTGDQTIWKHYGTVLKNILYSFREGTSYNIHMLGNGLLYAGIPGVPVTWMDAIVDGIPVTPRTGLAVEVNALWYNAIRFALELAEISSDKEFIGDWQPIADRIPAAFVDTFWIANSNYLADYVDGDYVNKSVRPNQILAASLPYSPLIEEQRKDVVDRVKNELLTPRGLRTLSPIDPAYKPEYAGNQTERDLAYHQGSVFPWLLGPFSEAYLKLHKKSGVAFIGKIYSGFEEVMSEHGIGTVSELYDGDPPHRPSGAISQAWSVAALLRMRYLIDTTKESD